VTAAVAILDELRSRGVRLELKGDRLRLRAPSAPPPELLQAAQRHRDELVGLLQSEERAGPELPAIGEGEIAKTRERLGAVLIRSRFGEVWLAIDPCVVPELETEEAGRAEPRPVLLASDLPLLKGLPDDAIRASLEVLRAFPGARVAS
jgi:hypothetical protein